MNNPYFVISAGAIVAISAVAALVLWMLSLIRYTVSAPFLKITWCGLVLRRIRLDDIKFISTKPVLCAERWCNTVHTANRLLVIHRHSGWCRNLIITPRNRFVLRAELLSGRKGISPLAPEAPPAGAEVAQTAESSAGKSTKSAA